MEDNTGNAGTVHFAWIQRFSGSAVRESCAEGVCVALKFPGLLSFMDITSLWMREMRFLEKVCA
jgi:hypothetical protein